MGRNKNLDDVIHGDRSFSRAIVPFKGKDPWDDWEPPSSKSHGGGGSGHKTSTGDFHQCFKTHPPLKLPGTELLIYGGSCISPVVKDADVYIGFDMGMHFSERHWPWKKGTELLFKISDMSTPSKPEEFKKLVAWTKKQLEAGQKVHCGCIGGHGRTGMFLAALVSTFGEKDAVTYVRENYCKKAVESTSQVNFLAEHFGITKVVGTKSSWETSSKGSKGGGSKLVEAVERFTPIQGNGCIWDKAKVVRL